MLVLLLALTGQAGPAADPWLGQLVMLRSDGLRIEVSVASGPPKQVALDSNAVYRVLSADGERLLLREKGQDGWLPKTGAVLVKEAPAFFAELIREHPTVGKYYGRRATAHQNVRRNDNMLALGDTPAGADLSAALSDLSEAVRLEPGVAKWWGDRAWVRLRLQRWDAARADAAEAVRLEPTRADWRLRRGLALEGAREFDLALHDYDEAIRLNPKLPEAWSARGDLLLVAKKEYKRAVTDYTAAIRLAPTVAVFPDNRGIAYARLGEYDNALADHTRATELDPHRAGPYYRRGDVYRWQRMWAKAVAEYSQAIEREPKEVWHLAGRGRAYLGLGDHERARADLRAAAGIEPTHPEAQASLAWFLSVCPEDRYRDGKAAVESARSALGKQPFEQRYHRILAAALAEAGDSTAALTTQELALKQARAEVAPHAETISKAERQLSRYRAGKPFRDTGDE